MFNAITHSKEERTCPSKILELYGFSRSNNNENYKGLVLIESNTMMYSYPDFPLEKPYCKMQSSEEVIAWLSDNKRLNYGFMLTLTDKSLSVENVSVGVVVVKLVGDLNDVVVKHYHSKYEVDYRDTRNSIEKLMESDMKTIPIRLLNPDKSLAYHIWLTKYE